MHSWTTLKPLADYLRDEQSAATRSFEESMRRASIGRLYYHAFHLSCAFLRRNKDAIVLYRHYQACERHAVAVANDARNKALSSWKGNESQLVDAVWGKSIHTHVGEQLGHRGNVDIQNAFKNLKRYRHHSDYDPVPSVTDVTVALAYEEFDKFWESFQKLP